MYRIKTHSFSLNNWFIVFIFQVSCVHGMRFTDAQFLLPALSVTFVCNVVSSVHCLTSDSAHSYYYVSITVLATEGKIDFPRKLETVGNYQSKVLITNGVQNEGFLFAALLPSYFVNLGTPPDRDLLKFIVCKTGGYRCGCCHLHFRNWTENPGLYILNNLLGFSGGIHLDD